jgi:hypothetical protein
MKPSRRGQVVKFQTPKGNQNQLYVVLEYIEDVIMSKVKIYAEKTGIVRIAFVEDLEVDEKQTNQLTRYLKVQNQSIYERSE